MHQSHLTSSGRYPVLQTIAILFLVSAILWLAYGVYRGIVALVGINNLALFHLTTVGMAGKITAFFIWLAMTFFAVLFNVAIAEGINLSIDIEHNIRMTATNTSATGAPTASSANTGDWTRGRLADESAESALLRGR